MTAWLDVPPIFHFRSVFLPISFEYYLRRQRIPKWMSHICGFYQKISAHISTHRYTHMSFTASWTSFAAFAFYIRAWIWPKINEILLEDTDDMVKLFLRVFEEFLFLLGSFLVESSCDKSIWALRLFVEDFSFTCVMLFQSFHQPDCHSHAIKLIRFSTPGQWNAHSFWFSSLPFDCCDKGKSKSPSDLSAACAFFCDARAFTMMYCGGSELSNDATG